MPDPARQLRVATLMALAVLAAGCGNVSGPGSGPPSGLAACGSAPLFTVPPIPIGSIAVLAPLGNLNPPGHTLPTDHLYFYPGGAAGTSNPVPLSAPGDITIHSVTRQTRSGGGAADLVDYGLSFTPCTDVDFYFAHISSITPALASQIGTFTSCNPAYSTGGFTYIQCYKEVGIRLAVGTAIGTAGGPGEGALDLGGYDRRVAPLAFVNPSRSYGSGTSFGQNQTICPVDYFTTAVRDSLRAIFGRPGRRRTVEPLCGTLMQDVANTAQGRWYFGQAGNDDPHLALVHDNVDPTEGAFSVGVSIPSLPSTVYLFTPATTGRLNLDFSRVTADGQLYCYEPITTGTRHILLQLTSSTTIRIEGGTGPTCGPSSGWALSAAAVTFSR